MECKLCGTRIESGIQCDTNKIIKLYKTDLKIDVSKYFKVEKVELYKCNNCGYNFYTPDSVAGDDEFYSYLQLNRWYYLNDKYEHKLTQSYINANDSVLEIGCGEGAFLDDLMEKGINCTGLELNKNAIVIGRKKGLNILNETIQGHSEKNTYNVICTFQVLEHIFDIYSFLNSCIISLKENGKLIIAVPNNNAFIKYSNDILNMPPHHMGLWNNKALSTIPQLFPELKLIKLIEEPLQEYHINYYLNTLNDRFINKVWGFRTLYHRFGVNSLVKITIKRLRRRIKGHSIIAIYSKS